MGGDNGPQALPTASAKLFSACLYAGASVLITFSNKFLLTNYKFPSFSLLAALQFLATCAILQFLKTMGLINFPEFSQNVVKKVFPLPILHLANVFSGLGGTASLSLPMFTALRRFSILFTMLLEIVFLGSQPSQAVVGCVAMMIGGAMYAAKNDLGFDTMGYVFIFSNDVFTALNGVYIKKKSNAKELNQFGLLYYNSLCSIPVMAALAYMDRGKMSAFLATGNTELPGFWVVFVLSVMLGALLNYSIYLCTSTNSALTTTVVGCMKNLVTGYAGIFGVGGDYKFTVANFVGLNISMLGSLIYTAIQYKVNVSRKRVTASTPSQQPTSSANPAAGDSNSAAAAAAEQGHAGHNSQGKPPV